MTPSSGESSDLEALEPFQEPVSIEQTPEPTPTRPRSRGVRALALLLAAVLGSALTIAIGHINHRSEHASVASTAISTTTVASNFVSRVRQPVQLDAWNIVVESYRLASVVEQQTALPEHTWLVVELAVTNAGAASRFFDSRQIVARYFEGGTWPWPEAPSESNTNIAPAPNQTLPLELAFSVPSSPKIYSIVVRKDLESEKQAGTAVEIDLNCC